MGQNRREFIQQLGGLLAALGISETAILSAGDRYYQALAQPTARKLALLVGINQYPGDISLSGALTDVALQAELLKYRFGFPPEDILILSNEQATRANIESAFIEHLINQASAGDLVVFHFSGYGRCLECNSGETTILKNSLIPVDGGLGDVAAAKLEVNDLLIETLWQLLAMLPTKRAIAVLDTSYTYPGRNFQGNLMIRSRPSPRSSQLTSAALAFQEKLKHQIPSTINPQNIPALILSATGPNQVATEAKWQGFSAGLFTLALTGQLWLATPATSLQSSLQKVSCTVFDHGGSFQQPQILKPSLLLKSNPRILPITPGENYGLTPLTPVLPSADGVIKSVEEGGKIQLWLGGLPASVLETYSVGSIFSVIPPTNSPELNPIRLQIRVRDGLTPKAQLLDPSTTALGAGQLVQETVRVLPRNLTLTVALDTDLQRIERVDATSAFASMPNISTVLKGEQRADCLFGRVRPDLYPDQFSGSVSTTSTQGSYGLFSVGQELLANTVGEGGEAVKVAAQRLAPYLEMLRAAKLIGLSANQGSSRLGVRVTLETTPEEQLLMQASTRRAPWPFPAEGSAASGESSILSLPVGSRIRYRIFNYSDRPIYSFLFGIHNSGSAIAFYPFSSQNQSKNQPEIEQNLIAPGTTLTLPDDAVGSAWSINGAVGLAKTHLICSSSPFWETFNALKPVMGSRGDGQGIITLQNPFKIAKSVLEDLHHASAAHQPKPGISDEYWALNVNHWATLSFIYQVV